VVDLPYEVPQSTPGLRDRPHRRTAHGPEIEVLVRIAEALSNEDVADALQLSVNTVKTHVKSIYRKLGVAGRSDAARRARELKLLPPFTRSG